MIIDERQQLYVEYNIDVLWNRDSEDTKGTFKSISRKQTDHTMAN